MIFRDEDIDIDEIKRKATKLISTFEPHCIVCNIRLNNEAHETRKCQKCGYDSYLSARECVKIHFKDSGLPQSLIDMMVKGFE